MTGTAPTGVQGPNRSIGEYSGYIFDLDGTIYLGDTLLSGAAELVRALKTRGHSLLFLSNNPTRTREEYRAKLNRLGIEAGLENILTSSYVMAEYLKAEAPGAAVFPVGEPPLRAELQAAGLRLTEDPSKIEYVVAAFDRTFDYHKLNVAFQAIRRGARFVATNPDRTCPVPGGEIPDCGAVIGALEGATGRKVEVVAGKPSPLMVRTALSLLRLPPKDCIIFGDRLETDIQMGRDAGIATALVLTGITRREQLEQSGLRPDYVLEDMQEVLGQL